MALHLPNDAVATDLSTGEQLSGSSIPALIGELAAAHAGEVTRLRDKFVATTTLTRSLRVAWEQERVELLSLLGPDERREVEGELQLSQRASPQRVATVTTVAADREGRRPRVPISFVAPAIEQSGLDGGPLVQSAPPVANTAATHNAESLSSTPPQPTSNSPSPRSTPVAVRDELDRLFPEHRKKVAPTGGKPAAAGDEAVAAAGAVGGRRAKRPRGTAQRCASTGSCGAGYTEGGQLDTTYVDAAVRGTDELERDGVPAVGKAKAPGGKRRGNEGAQQVLQRLASGSSIGDNGDRNEPLPVGGSQLRPCFETDERFRSLLGGSGAATRLADRATPYVGVTFADSAIKYNSTKQQPHRSASFVNPQSTVGDGGRVSGVGGVRHRHPCGREDVPRTVEGPVGRFESPRQLGHVAWHHNPETECSPQHTDDGGVGDLSVFRGAIGNYASTKEVTRDHTDAVQRRKQSSVQNGKLADSTAAAQRNQGTRAPGNTDEHDDSWMNNIPHELFCEAACTPAEFWEVKF